MLYLNKNVEKTYNHELYPVYPCHIAHREKGIPCGGINFRCSMVPYLMAPIWGSTWYRHLGIIPCFWHCYITCREPRRLSDSLWALPKIRLAKTENKNTTNQRRAWVRVGSGGKGREEEGGNILILWNVNNQFRVYAGLNNKGRKCRIFSLKT